MRKLAIAALSFAAAVFAANYILPVKLCPWLAVIFAAVGTALLAMRRKWLRGFVICFFALAVGMGWFGLHYLRFSVPAHKLDGMTIQAEARVLNYPQVYEEYSRVEVRLEIDGAPKLRALVYDRTGSVNALVPGMVIRGELSLKSADKRYGKDYDYYNSKDIYLTANTVSALESTDESGFDILCAAARLNRYLGDRIDRLFPNDTAPFMKSLILGDKSGLYEDEGLYLSMKRSGITHIVAVSGMHVAFLVGVIQLLLGVGRRSSLICILIVWCFVFITGAPPSAVRAGIMQTVLLLAPVLRRENDNITSLSAALMLILLLNPYAAANISLQLSFAAMAGIMLFGERIRNSLVGRRRGGAWRDIFEYPVDIFASSAAVMVFSVPLMAVHFGSISILAPLTNILTMWAVSLCFAGGIAAGLLSVFLPGPGALLAVPVAWLARYIFACSKLTSSIDFSVLYLDDRLLTWWLVLVYALFIIAGRVKKAPVGFRLVAPTILSALMLSLALGMTGSYYSAADSEFFTVMDVGQGQAVSVFSGDSTLLIDCGATGSTENAGETAGAYLRSRGRKSVDMLLLTHLHADHANGVSRLMAMIPVKTIVMPIDPNDEDGQLEDILAAADKYGVDVLYISENTELSIGNIVLSVYAPGEAGEANERCLMAKVSAGGYDMLVTGDSSKASERELIENNNIRDIELLIVGHHGSRYSNCGELLGSIGANTAVISVGYNTYGHPTNEVLERLDAYGYNIYRTDLNGNVEILHRRSYGEEIR